MNKGIKMELCSFILICGTLAGCGKSQETSATVYSFHGEDAHFSIANGVIVLGERDILDGGNLSVKSEQFQDIVGYTVTFYVLSGNEEVDLLSRNVTDVSGDVVSISESAGKISGEKGMIDSHKEDLRNHFYCKFVTESSNGQEDTYQIQLNVKEITE